MGDSCNCGHPQGDHYVAFGACCNCDCTLYVKGEAATLPKVAAAAPRTDPPPPAHRTYPDLGAKALHSSRPAAAEACVIELRLFIAAVDDLLSASSETERARAMDRLRGSQRNARGTLDHFDRVACDTERTLPEGAC